MDRVELADLAEQVLEVHKNTLFIDPFIKISVEIVEGDFVSSCIKDPSSPLSWLIKLNPKRHEDLYDIYYSIFESLVTILLSDLDIASDVVVKKEVRKGIISRLATSFSTIFNEEDEEYEDEDEDDFE